MIALAAFIGGCLYRIRGGVDWFKHGTQLARAVWALPTAVLIAASFDAWTWWQLPALAVTVFASVALVGHGQFMTMPDAFSGATGDRVLGMSVVGFLRGAIAFAPLGYEFAIVFAFIGLLHGPLYWLAWRLQGLTMMAEFFVGALTWAAVIQQLHFGAA